MIPNELKNDELFKAVLYVIRTANSGIVAKKIRELTYEEIGRSNSNIKRKVAFELYALLKLHGVGEKFNKTKGDKYNGFVFFCLRNLLIDNYRKEKRINSHLLYEGQSIDPYKNEFEEVTFGRRPGEKPKKPTVLNLNELKSKRTDIESVINFKEMLNIFKEFYGKELVEAVIDNNTLKEAMFALGKGDSYHASLKRLRRSKPKFKEFLRSKNINFEDLKGG